MRSFVISVAKGLIQAEAESPAVRRAVRLVEAAVVSAAVVYLRSVGVPV